MKLKGNIISGAKLATSVLRLNKYIKPLKRAKEAGDTARASRTHREVGQTGKGARRS